MLGTRPEERGPAWAAFAFLTALITSHTILETARDALFLSRLPATQLPFVYLAIAVISLGIARSEGRLLRGVSHQASLVGWTALAGIGTIVCWLEIPASGDGMLPASRALGLYGLYVGSGVVVALTSVHLWSVLAETVSITRAKRIFPLVGAGSSIGALAGSAAATALARVLPAQRLLLVAAVGFFVSAGAAAVLAVIVSDSRREAPAPPKLDLARDAGWALRHPYAKNLALFCLSSATALTFVDFVFKSTVAATVASSDLAFFFGAVTLCLSVLSLIAQLFVVPRLLRRLAVGAALAILPVGLLSGGLGLLVGLGLGAALAIKGADGTLRYSLHRTATELLYLPIPDGLRARLRTTLDVVGQRGGQAFASLLIITIVTVGAPFELVPLLLVLSCGVWIASALALRRPYVDLLGASLRPGATLRASAFPDLDLASLETLVAALDSPDDAEVVAAIDTLEREGKERLVPLLLLRHTSDAVVERALLSFIRSRRKSATSAIDRILDHQSPIVRSAAVAARSHLSHDAKLLYQRLALEEAPEVRATIVVQLVASGDIVGQEATDRLDAFERHGQVATRVALAEAIGRRESHALDDVIVRLAGAAEGDVRLAAVLAMSEHRSSAYLPSLVRAVGSEQTRAAAQSALVGYGLEGFEVVRRALSNLELPMEVRWALPHAMAAFDPEPAASVLVNALGREPEGIVRYRILRELEGIVARDPRIVLSRSALEPIVHGTLERAFRRIDERLILEAGANADGRRRTPGHELLCDLLRDKGAGLRDRLLRLLGLLHPHVDFASVRRGLASTSAKTRASSVELVASVVDLRLRRPIVALLDDIPDEERLLAAAGFHVRYQESYDELLRRMLEVEGESTKEIVRFVLAETPIPEKRSA
ncbi:MAG: hypothetical protein HOV80_10965 [Polyangiaceae bacterium]|nr:hypothetical protein [Polyangiaceae bacterium]